MRIRALKPDFFKSETVAKVSRDARLLFAGLWCMADAWGVVEDRPRRIRVELFPYDDLVADQVVAWIDDLVSAGLVRRYAIRQGGATVSMLWLPGLRRHQIGSMPKEERARPPKFPLPPGVTPESVMANDATVTESDTDESFSSPPPTDQGGASEVPQRVTGDGYTGDGRRESGRSAPPPEAKTHDDPEIRLAPWVRVGSQDAKREAENRATLASLLNEHGSPAVQRAAEALRHRLGRKVFPDELIAPLAQIAQGEDEIDPHDLAVRSALKRHGWQRCIEAADIPLRTVRDADQAALILTKYNRPAGEAMLAKLGGQAASGAA